MFPCYNRSIIISSIDIIVHFFYLIFTNLVLRFHSHCIWWYLMQPTSDELSKTCFLRSNCSQVTPPLVLSWRKKISQRPLWTQMNQKMTSNSFSIAFHRREIGEALGFISIRVLGFQVKLFAPSSLSNNTSKREIPIYFSLLFLKQGRLGWYHWPFRSWIVIFLHSEVVRCVLSIRMTWYILEYNLYFETQSPDLGNIPDPRMFHTHVPYNLLPPSIKVDNCKIIFVCRNPLDYLVSSWHFSRKIQQLVCAESLSLEEG